MSIAQECMERFNENFQEIVKKEREESLKRCNTFHASALGWALDCPRHLYLSRIPEYVEKAAPEESLQRIFLEGKEVEKVAIKALEAIVEPGTDIETPVNSTDIQISHDVKVSYCPDVLLYKDDICHAVGEIKSMASPIYRRFLGARDAEVFLEQSEPYLRHYFQQLMFYIYAVKAHGAQEKTPQGFFMLKSKSAFDYNFIGTNGSDPEARLELIFDTLQGIERRLKAGDIPEPDFQDVCGYCKFQAQCFPGGVVRSEGLAQVANAELQALLERRFELAAAKKEYESVDGIVKAAIKKIVSAGYPPNLQIGTFVAKMSEYQKTIYEVPDEIKNKYAKKIPIQSIRIKEVKLEEEPEPEVEAL